MYYRNIESTESMAANCKVVAVKVHIHVSMEAILL